MHQLLSGWGLLSGCPCGQSVVIAQMGRDSIVWLVTLVHVVKLIWILSIYNRPLLLDAWNDKEEIMCLGT